MTSEEATLLVASHLSHPTHSSITKKALQQSITLGPYAEGQERLHPVQDLPGTADRTEGAWVFEGDANAATHLIRNSLSGEGEVKRRELLSLKGPMAKCARDDITVQ